MMFSRFVPLAASIAAALAFAPALAQEHEVGWWHAPAAASPAPSAVDTPVHPSFSGGVFVASGDVNGDGQANRFNGFVSRFPAGGRGTPLDDPRLQALDAAEAGRYSDIALKRGRAAVPDSGEMTLKAQQILQNAHGANSTSWVRPAQAHTTGSVMPPRVGREARVDSAPKTALPAPTRR
jgi:hypothetical protein